VAYGFGLFHNEYKGLHVIKHSGNMTGFRAQVASFPEQNFTAIALCNNMAILPHIIVEKLADIYLEGQFKPEVRSEKSVIDGLPTAAPLSERDALRYAGVYAHPESGRFFKLTIRNGKLVNNEFFKKEVPVTAVSENRLLVVDGNGMTDLNPIFDKAGKIAEIRILDKSGKPDSFVPVKPPFDSPQQMTEYQGTFYSEELNGEHKISLKGNSLILQFGDSFEAPLVAAYADVFTTANGQVTLSFTRNGKGVISGFMFGSAADEREVKGIAFMRRS